NDVNFRLAVRVLPEGATGIMRYVDENRCEIHEIPKNAVIAVGDRVVTSGFSDIYPAGLPVGIVSGIFEERGSFQKVVTVDIYDKLNTIMHVFVISDNE
ncbi:MAG: rod shape-determining protein MreC, partial [Fidelibacterota bacterium]